MPSVWEVIFPLGQPFGEECQKGKILLQNCILICDIDSTLFQQLYWQFISLKILLVKKYVLWF